jgi:hypothetical protein
MWHGSCRMHVADPRVNVQGVTPRERCSTPRSPSRIAGSVPKQPDPDGRQFSEFVQLCQTLCLHEAQTFLIDHCALPQRPRTRAEAALFRRLLPQFQAQFKRQVLVLNEGSEDYRTRGG